MFGKLRSLALVAALALAPAILVAQGVVGIFQSGTASAPSVTSFGDQTSGLHFGTGFTAAAKHVVSDGGTIPTVTSCSTGAVGAGSTDVAGNATATGATACTVTFGTAWTTKPTCALTDNTTAAGLKAVVTTTTIAVTGLTSGDAFSWICIGQAGG